MKKNILVMATFIFFLIGFGVFSLTEEKRTGDLPPENILQGCSEDDQKTTSCSSESSPLFDTSENRVSTPDPKSRPFSTINKKTDRAKIEPEKGTFEKGVNQ